MSDATQPPRRRRVLFDVTEFQQWRRSRKHFTGIQRTMVEAGHRLLEDPEIELVGFAYDAAAERIYRAELDVLHAPNESEVAVPSAVAPGRRGLWERLNPVRQRLRQQPLLAAAYRAVRKRAAVVSPAEEIEFRPDDHVLLLGAVWIFPALLDRIGEEQRRLGFRVGTLLYDLIPIEYDHIYPGSAEPFAYYVDAVAGFSDRVFCISRTTEESLQRYCAAKGLAAPKTTVAYLGEGFSHPPETSRPRALPEGDYILTVSTFEPRKNYQVLYQAMKYADEQGLDMPNIVIVGREGHMTEELRMVIRGDRQVEGRLVWLPRVDDAELAWLYEHSLFTVFPSIAEGWGLPISESIFFGKFCIASGVTAMPEIAGDLIDYVSPYDTAGWARAIHGYFADRAALERRTERLNREYRPRGWDEFAGTFRDWATETPASTSDSARLSG